MAAGSQFSTTITATSSGGAVQFVEPLATGITLNAKSVLIINDGSSNWVRVNFTTTSGASTDDWILKAGESTSITAPAHAGYTGLSYGATAVTSVVLRVLATR